jgi:hypothetical protein
MLVHFDYGGVLRPAAKVEIAHDSLALSELPILVLLGWYQVVLLTREAGAAV